MAVVIAHDATHENISHLPKGQTCGYTTGSASIKWTAADWAAHPQGVRICQDSGTDHTADVLDVERGAATNGQVAPWYKAALGAYQAGARPGQRAPAVYTSASNVTPLVNALIGAGVKSGPKLWIAKWDDAVDADKQAVRDASGPFPIIGFQFINGPFYDSDVFSSSWLGDVSAKPGSTPHRHVTAAGDTVASLAASRGMRPDTWLALQHTLGADVAALASGPLPAGITWLSVNP